MALLNQILSVLSSVSCRTKSKLFVTSVGTLLWKLQFDVCMWHGDFKKLGNMGEKCGVWKSID